MGHQENRAPSRAEGSDSAPARSGEGPGRNAPEARVRPDLHDLLQCISSPVRLSTLAAMARQPRSTLEIAGGLRIPESAAAEHVRELEACELLEGRAGRWALTDRVEVRESGAGLHFRVRSREGSTVDVALPSDAEVVKLLARGFGSAEEAPKRP